MCHNTTLSKGATIPHIVQMCHNTTMCHAEPMCNIVCHSLIFTNLHLLITRDFPMFHIRWWKSARVPSVHVMITSSTKEGGIAGCCLLKFGKSRFLTTSSVWINVNTMSEMWRFWRLTALWITSKIQKMKTSAKTPDQRNPQSSEILSSLYHPFLPTV